MKVKNNFAKFGHYWLLCGAVCLYTFACFLPCVVVPGSNAYVSNHSYVFTSEPILLKGWECLWLGAGNKSWLCLPNPILFVSWVLLIGSRASAKYWALAALVIAIAGFNRAYIWPGAGLWVASMALSVVAGFLLVPYKSLTWVGAWGPKVKSQQSERLTEGPNGV